MNLNESMVDDVSSASAAYVLSASPSFFALPPPEAFERLKQAFIAAFLAYFDGQEGVWGPEASVD